MRLRILRWSKSLDCAIGPLHMVLYPRPFVSPACTGISSSDKKASSEFAPGACSALPGWAFVTAAVPLGEGLDWCFAIMVGVTMVGDLSFPTFARDELLVEHLAG